MYVADMHCDTISQIYNGRKKGERTGFLSNSCKVDIRKLLAGGYILQNFAVFVDILEEENPYQAAKNQIALFKEEIGRNDSRIRPAVTMAEIEDNRKAGRVSAMLTLEEGEICQGDLRRLEEFYREGVRMMTFTWNYDNSLGARDGLTELGIAFLEKMEEIGIIPDVSHLSERGFYDVCRYGRRPFVASHSNAAELCPHARNLSDDMIQKVAERGGVIGVNFYGLFLEEGTGKERCYGRVARIADHILHMIQVGGISCAGLGTDFDGFAGDTEISDCSKMWLLERELKKRGLSASEREAVFYKNVLRVYREYLTEPL